MTIDIYIPCRARLELTRIVIAYSRPPPATKRTKHAPINIYGQQAQVSQGQTSCRNKGKYTEVHGDGGLELVELAREQVSSHPTPLASLKNDPGILPVHRTLLALEGRNHTVAKDELSSRKSPGSRLCFSCSEVQHPPDSSTIELPSALA